jgi:hypothetical protein
MGLVRYVSLTGRTLLKQQGKNKRWLQLGAPVSLVFICVHSIQGHTEALEYTHCFCWGNYVLLLDSVRMYDHHTAEPEDYEESVLTHRAYSLLILAFLPDKESFVFVYESLILVT